MNRPPEDWMAAWHAPSLAADRLEFDFVIVGAGSAGCVLANRLTADPKNRVCLIEAGPRDTSPFIHVPIGLTALYNHKQLNWCFSTVPQVHAGNRRVFTPRGKVLGGTSAINGMIYIRGYPEDYDDWAAAGNAGWSFDDVLPYFLRSENNESWPNSPLHGSGGELNVTDLETRNPSAESFIEAAGLFQIPYCKDFNGPRPDGAGYRQVTQRRGRRETTATAFLRPAQGRTNLTILTGCMVDKVLFEGTTAVGVRVERNGTVDSLRARREVILSAGAYGSPEILMRSGVGNPSDLKASGVEVVHGLAGVGQNLQDHAAVSMAYETRSTIPYGISVTAAPKLVWAAIDYALNRRGLLASNVIEAAAFVRTSPELPRTDLQLSFMSGKRGGNAKTGTTFGYGHGYSLTAIQLRPFGRGEVRLNGPDPRSGPLIDPRFFADERDLDVLVRGFKLSREILNSEPFERYGGTEITPGPVVATDDEIRNFIRNGSGTAFHPVGTCAMGSEPDAVVDQQLRVRGVQQLRVIDASIMPTIIGGNTNAPTIMIAEKGADMVLGRTPPNAIHLSSLETAA